jgi:glucose/arabinose dehydrogenase
VRRPRIDSAQVVRVNGVTKLVCALVLFGALGVATAPARGAVGVVEVGTYESPVYVTSDPGDQDRLFVVERNGLIKLTEGGETTTFLDITSLVATPGINDLGLLSMAFAPDYLDTGHLYVFYTGAGNDLQVDEFTAVGDSAALETRRSVLDVEHASPYHYGGQLQFGPDGYLYVSTGDAGAGIPFDPPDPLGAGQDLETLHSKILRIDPDPAGTEPYSVPQDNPYVGEPGRDEIWSTGLRNPWRFSFDRLTGDLVIADVGQAAWEEIIYAPRSAGGGRGENYGWSCREGPDPMYGCEGDFTEAAFNIPHSPGGFCSGSVTGGYVVRDPGLPELYGRYVYVDFCKGDIRSLQLGLPSASDDRAENLFLELPATFGEDTCGRIYVASITGAVYRLTGSGPEVDCRLMSVGAERIPVVRLRGKRRQAAGDPARVSITAVSDEAATIRVTAKALAKDAEEAALGLEEKSRHVAAGSARRLSWKLGAGFRGLLAEGIPVRVRFRATATDALGNRSASVERVVRLVPAG